MRPIRVAISTLTENPRRPTGLLSYFLQITGNLPKFAPDIQLILVVPKDAADHYRTRIGQEVKVVACGPSGTNRVLRILTEHLALPLLLEREKADILYMIGAGVAPLILPRRTKLALNVIATQQLTTANLPSNVNVGLLSRLYRRAMMSPSLGKADMCMVNSAYTGAILKSHFPELRTELEVVRHGVDDRLFHDNPLTSGETARLTALGVTKPYVLFVGQMYPYKMAHVLVEAFCKLATECKLPHQLVMIGHFDGRLLLGEKFREKIQSTMTRAGLADRLVLLPSVDVSTLRATYAGADAYVQTSIGETFGRTVLESMACGTPVVAARAAATPEILGEAGLYYTSPDADECAEQLGKLLTDETLRRHYARLGVERAKEFSFAAEVERLAVLFRRLHETGY